MGKVSIVLPSYNCAKYIGDAIESVLNQTYANYELIIVNDGSTDDTEQVLSKYLSNNSSIIYIKQENKGHAGARNTGMAAATGAYIAFIDSDDKWLPEKLMEQVQECRNDPEVIFVHSNVYGFSDNEEPKLGRSWLTQKQIEDHSGYIFDAYFFRQIRITTTTVLIKKECIDDVGMFDENLTRFGSEDRDLFLRILRKYKAKYINKPLAMYRNRSDSAGQNYEKMIKGQEYVYEKMTKMYGLPNSVKKAVMSKIYQEWARGFYSNGHFSDGFTNQAKAIKENPVDAGAYLALKQYLKHLINKNV